MHKRAVFINEMTSDNSNSQNEVCVKFYWYFEYTEIYKGMLDSSLFGAENSRTKFFLRIIARDSLYLLLASCDQPKLFVNLKIKVSGQTYTTNGGKLICFINVIKK